MCVYVTKGERENLATHTLKISSLNLVKRSITFILKEQEIMKQIRKGKRKISEYKINKIRNLGNKIYLLN